MVVPTVKYLTTPKRYLDHGDFDLHEFSHEYQYATDPLWGLWDIAQDVDYTLEKGEGDCVDWTRMSVAWLWHNTHRPISIYLLVNRFVTWNGLQRWPISTDTPGHVIVWDGRNVYSNGNILQMDIEDYMDNPRRFVGFRRRVRGSVGPRMLY